MTPISYLKLQAKNLFRDYKTQTSYTDEVTGASLYKYEPKHLDIGSILFDYEYILEECHWDEKNLTLMNIQHIFANVLGFNKWADLVNAPEAELELTKLRFDNQDKISLHEWNEDFDESWRDFNSFFKPQGALIMDMDLESKLVYFKHGLSIVEKEGISSYCHDYRINQGLKNATKNATKKKKTRQVMKPAPDQQITSLPLSEIDREEFIATANSVFESVIERIEPNNPALTRKLWNAEDYVDFLLHEDMLPISKDYALSLIDAFLVHHVIWLAEEADKKTA